MNRRYQGSSLFGLNFWAQGFEAAKELLVSDALGSAPCRIVITPNVDHLVRLHTDLHYDEDFASAYGTADYLFPDGTPIVWLSKLVGQPIRERVTGADLFPALCAEMALHGQCIFVLGGQPGEECRIKQKLEEKYEGLSVEVFAPSFPFDPTGDEAEQACLEVSASNAAIVFVCLGLPKQERWAMKFQSRLTVRLALCVGAAIDFELGNVSRAPGWVQKMGMEWFWRMCSSPQRLLGRYVKDIYYFFPMALREIIKARKVKKWE